MKTTTKHDEWLSIKLKDADFAAEFLNAASQDGDPNIYLIALKKLLRLEVEWPLLPKKVNFPVKPCIEPIRSCTERCCLAFQSDPKRLKWILMTSKNGDKYKYRLMFVPSALTDWKTLDGFHADQLHSRFNWTLMPDQVTFSEAILREQKDPQQYKVHDHS